MLKLMDWIARKAIRAIAWYCKCSTCDNCAISDACERIKHGWDEPHHWVGPWPKDAECGTCRKQGTMECPNSSLCYSKKDRPYFEQITRELKNLYEKEKDKFHGTCQFNPAMMADDCLRFIRDQRAEITAMQGEITAMQAELAAYRQAEQDGVLVRVPRVGDTVCLDTVGPFGVQLGKLPYTVMGISVNLYGDWGGVTQIRDVSIEEARAAMEV